MRGSLGLLSVFHEWESAPVSSKGMRSPLPRRLPGSRNRWAPASPGRIPPGWCATPRPRRRTHSRRCHGRSLDNAWGWGAFSHFFPYPWRDGTTRVSFSGWCDGIHKGCYAACNDRLKDEFARLRGNVRVGKRRHEKQVKGKQDKKSVHRLLILVFSGFVEEGI